MNGAVAGIEGRLAIRLAPRRGAVKIESTRPLHAARLLEGKTIDETLTLVPLLFSICGQAQALAAVRAIESAHGRRPSTEVERRRDRLKALETLREHLWRTLLDAPLFYQAQPARQAMTRLMAEIEALKGLIDPRKELLKRPGLAELPASDAALGQRWQRLRAGIESEVLGCPLEQWLTSDPIALLGWVEATDKPAPALLRFVRGQGWEDLGRCAARAMSDLPDNELARRLDATDAERFIAAPNWRGEPLETGPLARLSGHPLLAELAERHGNGLLTRLVARLIELARIALDLPQRGAEPERRSSIPGLCQLEAARGRLVHRVELDGERVRRYRILAPTEWNFHPAGAAAQALATVTDDDPEKAEAQARLLVHAIDPCVACTLAVETG